MALRADGSGGAVLALTLVGSGAGTVAAALPARAAVADNSDVAYCRSIEGLFGDDIFGPCMSYYNSHNRSAAATDVYFCETQFVPEGLFDTRRRDLVEKRPAEG